MNVETRFESVYTQQSYKLFTPSILHRSFLDRSINSFRLICRIHFICVGEARDD